MPFPHSYAARDAKDIETALYNNQKSTLVYLIMAQPIKENVPPFVLSIFGTDNRFCTYDVVKRWEYMAKELDRYV